MSYTTRCPACGTTFKVVPDQLKISDGWVRCGYCSDVFDATLNLQPWDDAKSLSGTPDSQTNADPVNAGNPPQHTRTRVFSAPSGAAAGSAGNRGDSRVAPPAMVNAMAAQMSAQSSEPATAASMAKSDRIQAAPEPKDVRPTGHAGSSSVIPPESPTPVAQFLSVADEPPVDPGVQPDEAASSGAAEAVPVDDEVEVQRKEMSHEASDEWGDVDFMTELRRYAEEVKAEKAVAPAPEPVPEEPKPAVAARPVPVPLPPLPSKVRPTPRRSSRDYSNERHAADALSESHDSESSDSVDGLSSSAWDSVLGRDAVPDGMEGRPSVLRVDLTAEASARAAANTVRTRRKTEESESEDEVPMAEDDVPSRLLEEGVELSFVQQAKRRAFWHSAGVRWTMTLFSLALAALLGVQWALQSRNELLAAKPELRPVLAALCGVVGCELGPAHQIEHLSIDFNELRRRLDNLYTLEFAVRNDSKLPLAVPAVELTLPQGRSSGALPIARRVFLPQEWPGHPAIIQPGERLQVNLSLTVSSDIDLIAAGQYNLYLFYP